MINFGVLRNTVPVFCGVMGIALFSSLGLPGLNGFVGEFLIFKGSFPLVTWATGLAVVGLLLTAVFVLNVLQRVFWGPANDRWSGMPDLTLKERLALVLPIALIFVLGIYPQALIRLFNETVNQLVQHLRFSF